VGHCIRQALNRVFASAQTALERDLEKTTLGDVMDAVKRPLPRANRELRIANSERNRIRA
jgi:hypothetical protein